MNSPTRSARIRRSTGIDMLDGKGANAGGAQRLRNTLLAAMGMGRLRHQAASERRRHGRGLRLVAGAGDRKLDRLRGPCCRRTFPARSRSRS